MTAEISSALPLPAILAPVPPEHDLTDDQWKVLEAVCDTVIPAFSNEQAKQSVSATRKFVPADTPDEAIIKFFEERPSEVPGFRQLWRRILFRVLPEADRKTLLLFVNLLHSPMGSLLLTSSSTTFPAQPLQVREQILNSWGDARLGAFRLLKSQFLLLAKQAWARTTPTLKPMVGIPRVPLDGLLGKAFEFNFIQIPPGEGPEVIETDVVIVGSGCGGGVAAKVLSETGLRVLVVDKGFYWPPEYLPMTEDDGTEHMMMHKGLMARETWGGGGTVNWSASLSLPGYVRRDWASKGLGGFASAEFQESVDRVSREMGVSTEHIKHSKPNQKLAEGSRRLGWRHADIPQNTGGAEHSCGHCSMGCRSSGKKGPAVSFLPRASEAGARFIEGLDVREVLFEKESLGGYRVAKGVRGTWRSRDEHGGVSGAPVTTREVVISAKKVVVSGGTMQSPLLLLRSGLRNRQIGRNLYLHPVSILGAAYEEELEPWHGPILSTVCSEFENLDGQGHGVKLEAISMMPYTWLNWIPWNSGAEYKRMAARMRHMGGYISLARDRDPGRVYPDPADGRCKVAYTASKLDKQHILEGLVALAQIHYEAGAQEIFTIVPGTRIWKRGGDGEKTPETSREDFEQWIADMRRHGFPSPENMLVSAHQMGTCRMSARPKDGVVGPDGQVWGTKGLYVADASVFPTASGVNPMLTTMSVSDYLSTKMAQGWTRERL